MDEHPAPRQPASDPAGADPLIVGIGRNGFPGEPVPRSTAHQAPGVLHLAVSLQVVDRRNGGWLLQQRASSKLLFPNRWANSSCTHPAPGEVPASAAIRRLREETGLVVEEIIAAGRFTYRAVDSDSAFVEHEQDHVFVALADSNTLTPDPEEIADVAVLPFEAALSLVQSFAGAPWAAEVLRRSYQALNGNRP